MTTTPMERQQAVNAAYLMREFRRSDPWDILQVALTAQRDNVLRRLAEPRDLGLEGLARLRGELAALDWVLRLPEEIIRRASNE